MLKALMLLSAVALVLLVPSATSANPPQESASAKNAPKAAADPAARGKVIYQRDCALCHGANGDGKTDLAKDMQLTMADWTDPKTLEGQTDQQLFHIIRNGKDKMPSEDVGRAKDDEVRDMIVYIRTLAKAQPAPASPTAPAATMSNSPAAANPTPNH